MKKFYALLICCFCFAQIGFAQTNFESESDVLAFLEGKTFYSTDQTVKVKIGYSSTLNTYGIILNGSLIWRLTTLCGCYELSRTVHNKQSKMQQMQSL